MREQLSDGAIIGALGPEAYRRGAMYVRQGRVSDLSVASGGRIVLATVHGSGRRPYSTVVSGETGRWSGDCSCPVGENCKHVAAVLLAARDALGSAVAASPPVAAWERPVAALLDGAGRQETRTGTPVALQFEVTSAASSIRRFAAAPAPQLRIRIRPVVPGKHAGTWVRTGVSWRELQQGYGVRGERAHLAALRDLHAASGQQSYDYYYYDSGIHLDEFGPVLWPLLEQVVAVGVPLVPAKGTPGPVALAREPARVALDLRRGAETADVTLEPVVTVDGVPRSTESVNFLGDPAHGLALSAGGPAAPAGPGLLLAPLAERATKQVSELLSGGQSLRIPAADVDRFLREFYPGLRQVVHVTSSDETVALPEIPPPTLGLAASYAPGHRVTLEWSFRYEVAGRSRRLSLYGSGPTRTVRDARTEQQLLAGLDLPVGRLPQLHEPADGRLVPEVTLQGMDAVFFTEDVLPALRARDDVVVEVAGAMPEYRASEAEPVIAVSATDSAGDADWFDLGVTVSIDGEQIPFTDLFVALAHGDSHLVLASGTYFAIERPEFDQLRRLIDEARALQDAPSDGLRISRYQAGLWEELLELGVVDAQSERWARTVGGLLELDEVAPAAPPAGLDAQLRPYQLQGYQWLSFLWDHGLGGILADDMGLGKTLQTLAVICRARQEGRLPAPVLVVAPTSVVANWAREAARFAPGLSVTTVTETERRRGAPLAEHTAGADLVITSYALLRIDQEAYDALPWSALVLDEAQFVKNHQARTYQAARKLPAPLKLAITGTPLENNLMDLWSLLSIVAPGLFPSPQRFTEFYRKPIERGGDPELLAALRRRVRPLIRRRTKEQVAAELPAKQEQVLEVALNPRHRKIYQTHLQRERQKVLGLIDDLDRNRFTIFRSLTLLRQLSLDPALVDETYADVRASKVDVLMENLQEVLGEGHRALVFSQFTGFLRTVRNRLDADGIRYTYLDGRTRDRAQRIEEFKVGSAPLFLISMKAGGFGLNLTEADYVFVLDPWWNPAVEAQAVDRTHRIGQDKTVMVYRLVSTDTIEEKVMELKARKAALFARIMDDGGELSAPLSAEDIRGLFAS